MKKQLYLLDAYALIYRAYFPFAKRPRLDSKGNDTSAVYGFVSTLNDLLASFRPEYMAVVFDPSGKNFRHELYPPYKANRDKTPEAISFGVPYIKAFLQAMNIAVIEVEGYEADDVIGTLSVKAEKEGCEVLMVTPDKDYTQLVTPNISLLAPINGGGYEEIGVSDVLRKYEIANTRQVIDMLAIIGDSADNFPGIKGIGIKGAVKLLSEYGSLEGILEHADEISGSIGTKVRESKDIARVCKELATIVLDVPVPFDMEQYLRKEPNMPAVTTILSELELRTQMKRMVSIYGSKTIAEPISSEQPDLFATGDLGTNVPGEPATIERALQKPVFEHYSLKEDTARDVFLAKLQSCSSLYLHAVMYGDNSLSQDLLSVAFALDNSDVCYYLSMQEDVFFDPKLLLKELIEAIPQNAKLIGHDLKAHYLSMRKYGLVPKPTIEDTMIAHYLLMPDMSHHLLGLSLRYLSLELQTFEELIAPQKNAKLVVEQIDGERLSIYTAERVYATKLLHTYLIAELKDRNQLSLFYNLEMPLLPILLDMELLGVAIDGEELSRQQSIMQVELEELEREIHDLAGHEFNVNSTRQVGEVLFDELVLDEKAKKTKTGIYTTSEEVLEKYRTKHPIVAKILEYRGYRKLLSTYIEALPLLADSEGRVHTSFNQTVAATGRLSSSNPNIQNIPIRTERGRAIRAAFVPDNGEVFLSADYSQIELRLMAHFSQDRALIEAFTAKLDVHLATAARISGVSIEEVTADMRRNAKTANFGIIYGVSAFGLAEQLGISRAEAKTLIDGYFASYPGVAEYMSRVVAEARSKGYVETIAGRRRYLPDIDNPNAVVRGYAERNAINAPLQGTAADIIKQAMILIDTEIKARGLSSRMLLQVHDELNFSVPENELEEMRQLVTECMERAGEGLRVPLEVGLGVGNNWLEAH